MIDELTSLRDRMLFIRTLPNLNQADEGAVAMLAEHARFRSFRAGESVLRLGELASAVYPVLQGQITARRHGSIIAVARRPHGVGLLSILSGDDQIVAVADVDTQALELPKAALMSVLEDNFSMYRAWLINSTENLVKKLDKLPMRPGSTSIELGVQRKRPRTVVEIAMALRRTDPVFRSCNLDAVYDMARALFEVRVEPGEVLWRIGEPSSWWLRVNYGRIHCVNDEGAAVDVGSDFSLGMMDALARLPRSFEARAETPIIGYRSDLEPFLGILENHFDLARELLAFVVRTMLSLPERPSS